MTAVLITPRSLKDASHPALAPLRDAGYELVFPSPGRLPSPEELKAALPPCAAWLAGVEPIRADIMDAAPKLRVISRNGVGVDTVDLDAAKARGIAVRNTPGANSRGVAELCLALIFSMARSIGLSSASVKTGGWERAQGFELEGKTLGLIGCGQIGKHLARMATGIGMRVVAYDMYPDNAFSPPGFSYASAEEVLEQADVLSLHIPGGDRPFLNADRIGRMRQNAFIVNTARAGVVDQDALLNALDGKRLAGYAVDVFDPEPPGVTRLTAHAKTLCTAHLGGFTGESVLRAALRAAENIVEHLSHT